jgi:hypothetical protein
MPSQIAIRTPPRLVQQAQGLVLGQVPGLELVLEQGLGPAQGLVPEPELELELVLAQGLEQHRQVTHLPIPPP